MKKYKFTVSFEKQLYKFKICLTFVDLANLACFA